MDGQIPGYLGESDVEHCLDVFSWMQCCHELYELGSHEADECSFDQRKSSVTMFVALVFLRCSFVKRFSLISETISLVMKLLLPIVILG